MNLDDPAQVTRLQAAQRRLAQLKDIVATTAASLRTAESIGSWRLEQAHREIEALGVELVAMQRRLIAALIDGQPAVGAEAQVDAAASRLLDKVSEAEAAFAHESAEIDRLFGDGDGALL